MANLHTPTPMSSQGERIEVLFACYHSSLLPCRLMEYYFAPNLQARTDGQVTFKFRDILGGGGLDRTKLLDDLANGSLEGASVVGLFFVEEIPAFEIPTLHGIYLTREQSLEGYQAIAPDMDNLVRDKSGGVVLNHHWFLHYVRYLFCNAQLQGAQDLQGIVVNSATHQTLLDWMDGIGFEIQNAVSAPDVANALNQGTFDCVHSSPETALGLKWHQASTYFTGPIVVPETGSNVINRNVWEGIPPDLQRIILEEAAKSELEALRLASGQISGPLSILEEQDFELIPFPDEIQQLSRQVTIEHVIPAWVDRVGSTSDPIIADTYNNKLGPIVGLRINSDGTVTDTR